MKRTVESAWRLPVRKSRAPSPSVVSGGTGSGRAGGAEWLPPAAGPRRCAWSLEGRAALGRGRRREGGGRDGAAAAAEEAARSASVLWEAKVWPGRTAVE